MKKGKDVCAFCFKELIPDSFFRDGGLDFCNENCRDNWNDGFFNQEK